MRASGDFPDYRKFHCHDILEVLCEHARHLHRDGVTGCGLHDGPAGIDGHVAVTRLGFRITYVRAKSESRRAINGDSASNTSFSALRGDDLRILRRIDVGEGGQDSRKQYERNQKASIHGSHPLSVSPWCSVTLCIVAGRVGRGNRASAPSPQEPADVAERSEPTGLFRLAFMHLGEMDKGNLGKGILGKGIMGKGIQSPSVPIPSHFFAPIPLPIPFSS